MSVRRVVRSSTGRILVVAPSPIGGRGVFAGQAITKNSRIVEYAGEKISAEAARPREARHRKQGRVWCFTINRRWVRDAAVGGNVARFINHSCRGNCYVEIAGDVIWIRASRNIRPGEELAYDYNTGGEVGLACRCRPGCAGTL